MTVNITLHYSQFKYDLILALETFFFYIKSTLDLQLLHILSHKKDVAYVSNLNNKVFFYVNSWTFDFQMSLHRTQYLRLRLRSKVNEMKFHSDVSAKYYDNVPWEIKRKNRYYFFASNRFPSLFAGGLRSSKYPANTTTMDNKT